MKQILPENKKLHVSSKEYNKILFGKIFYIIGMSTFIATIVYISFIHINESYPIKELAIVNILALFFFFTGWYLLRKIPDQPNSHIKILRNQKKDNDQ